LGPVWFDLPEVPPVEVGVVEAGVEAGVLLGLDVGVEVGSDDELGSLLGVVVEDGSPLEDVEGGVVVEPSAKAGIGRKLINTKTAPTKQLF
jgi:hypothetical protein